MGNDRERDDRGRYRPEHADDAVVEAVRAHEPAGTSEVAGELGIARQSADYRLRQLREEGRVAVKKVGHTLVWSVDDG